MITDTDVENLWAVAQNIIEDPGLLNAMKIRLDHQDVKKESPKVKVISIIESLYDWSRFQD
jgi:hypothetical protein